MSGLGNPGDSPWFVARSGDGDGREARFAELYSAHFAALVVFCGRQLRGAGDAEEVAQEAFLRAWASWDRYAVARPFWPWVSTIARRLCIDQTRRQRRALNRADADAAAAADVPPPEPDEAVIALDEYAWARAAFAALRPRQQRVLNLRELDGWSYDQIASHEGVTVEAVRGSLKRSRQALRDAYRRVAEWNPVFVAVLAVREAARRAFGHTRRTHVAASVSGLLNDRAANAVAVAVAVGLGAAGGGGLSNRPPLPTVPAAAPLASPPRSSGGAPVDGTGTGAGAAGSRAGPAAGGVGDGSARRASPGGRVTPPDTGLRVPGQGGATPEEAEIVSFTPSPDYQHDGEVYASGLSTRGCWTAQCPALFRSTDGGTSWQRVWSIDFGGGTVMLPPSYPVDHRIFEIDDRALRVSADGGHLFRPLTPLGGHAAMSPGFSSADRQILVGAMPGWIYHDDNSVVTPFDRAPSR